MPIHSVIVALMNVTGVDHIFPPLNEIRRALLNPDTRHNITFAHDFADKPAQIQKTKAALAAAAQAMLERRAFVVDHDTMIEDVRPTFERDETIIANPPFAETVIFVVGEDKTCQLFVATRTSTGAFGIGPDGPLPRVLDLVTAQPSRFDGEFHWLTPGYFFAEDPENEATPLVYLTMLLWAIETYKLKPTGPPR